MFVLKWNSIFVKITKPLLLSTKLCFEFTVKEWLCFWPHHDNKPKKLTKKLTAPLKMESVTIIFSMFRLVFVEILSYGVRYTLIINKMCVVHSCV